MCCLTCLTLRGNAALMRNQWLRRIRAKHNMGTQGVNLRGPNSEATWNALGLKPRTLLLKSVSVEREAIATACSKAVAALLPSGSSLNWTFLWHDVNRILRRAKEIIWAYCKRQGGPYHFFHSLTPRCSSFLSLQFGQFWTYLIFQADPRPNSEVTESNSKWRPGFLTVHVRK